jgi:hypothetical protein
MFAIQENELTCLEKRILTLYSQGESYRRIQRELRKETGENFDKRKLGERMGEIKKKMNCQTQFQMGYKYATGNKLKLIETIKINFENKKEFVKNESFKRGEDAGFIQGKIQTEDKKMNRGLYAGFITATSFWFMVAYLICYYHLMPF